MLFLTKNFAQKWIFRRCLPRPHLIVHYPLYINPFRTAARISPQMHGIGAKKNLKMIVLFMSLMCALRAYEIPLCARALKYLQNIYSICQSNAFHCQEREKSFGPFYINPFLMVVRIY